MPTRAGFAIYEWRGQDDGLTNPASPKQLDCADGKAPGMPARDRQVPAPLVFKGTYGRCCPRRKSGNSVGADRSRNSGEVKLQSTAFQEIVDHPGLCIVMVQGMHVPSAGAGRQLF